MLVILTFLSFILIESIYGKDYHIICGDCIVNKTNAFGNCTTTKHNSDVNPGNKEVTAPRPELVNISYYIFKNNKNESELGLNLTWSHAGSHFLNVHGYSLEIRRTNSITEMEYIFFNVQLHETIALKSSDKVVLNYPCYERNADRLIAQDNSYSITIKSLPGYHLKSDDEANKISFFLYIPGCNDEKVKAISRCQSDYFVDYIFPDYNYGPEIQSIPTTQVALYRFSDDKNFVLILVVIFIIVFVLVLLIFSIFTWNLKNKYFNKKSSILLLISTFDKVDDQDHQYLKAADKLCNILKLLGAVDVITNVWNDVNISEPLGWFDENVKNCKHIVLVCTPLGKKNWMKKNMNDMFVMGYQMYRKQRIKKRWFSSSSHKFSLIYFDANSTVCIPDQMIKDKIKYQNIKVSLPSFFMKLTGKKLCTDFNIVISLKNVLKSINSRTHFLDSDSSLMDIESACHLIGDEV